jgi:hypothetical protein
MTIGRNTADARMAEKIATSSAPDDIIGRTHGTRYRSHQW